MKISKWIVLVLVFISGANITVFAADNEMSEEERLNRLERLVNSKGLVDIMIRVESMQGELQRLLGEIELQKHSLEGIKKRQRDLYVDIDRRLLQIERGSGVSSSAPPVSSPPSQMSPQTSSSKNVATPKAIKVKEGEQVAYQKAFDLLRALRYAKATKAFRQFLNDFPDGRYAHIAQYWLAETSYHTRKYETAVKDYQTLVEHYPNSPKRADALLKIAYSQFELKSFSKAKTVLNKLLKSYPGTTEAGQAENLLRKIRLKKTQ